MIVLYKIKYFLVVYILLIIIVIPNTSIAQRLNHSNPGGSSSFSRAAPTITRSNPVVSRPTSPQISNRPSEAPLNRTINGGSINNGNHNFSRNNQVNYTPPPTPTPKLTRPVENSPVNVNENTIVHDNRGNSNNHENINVHENVSVYHSANQSNHPYSYHPYHPSSCGPSWHPIGFFARSLVADAFLFSFLNQQYYYDDGVYYEPSAGGYIVVTPPIGSVVNSLPIGYEAVQVGNNFFDYYAGVFYIAIEQGYQVVAAPLGAVVTNIPDGASEQNINGQTYLFYNNTYYQPFSENGQDAYEVVQIN